MMDPGAYEELTIQYSDALILLVDSSALFRQYEMNHRSKAELAAHTEGSDSPRYRDMLSKAEANKTIADRIDAFLTQESDYLPNNPDVLDLKAAHEIPRPSRVRQIWSGMSRSIRRILN